MMEHLHIIVEKAFYVVKHLQTIMKNPKMKYLVLQ